MKTQQLSIDPDLLASSKAAAEQRGESWSAYVARALRRQSLIDSVRRAAADDARLAPAEQAQRDAVRRYAGQRRSELTAELTAGQKAAA